MIGARRVQSLSIVRKGKVPVRVEIQASEVGLGPVRGICVGQIVVEIDACVKISREILYKVGFVGVVRDDVTVGLLSLDKLVRKTCL